jgi:hypothetical protein
MFKPGHLYLERIQTGGIAFKEDGPPEVTPTKHLEVFEVISQQLTKDKETLGAAELEPETFYLRVFEAPKADFDAHGELVEPTFKTVGFIALPHGFNPVDRHDWAKHDIRSKLTDRINFMVLQYHFVPPKS